MSESNDDSLRSGDGSFGSRLAAVANLLVVLAIGWFLLNPDGPIGGAAANVLEQREFRAMVQEEYPALVGTADLGSMPIVQFLDFRCPACAATHVRLADFLESRPNFFVHRYVPRAGAEIGAKAGICVEGSPAQDAVFTALYSTQGWESTDFDWYEFAASAGVSNAEQFVACLQSDRVVERLALDRELAGRVRLTGTPTFLGPRRMHVGFADSIAILGLLPDQ